MSLEKLINKMISNIKIIHINILNNDDMYNNEFGKNNKQDVFQHKNYIFCVYYDKAFTKNNNIQHNSTSGYYMLSHCSN